MTGCEHAWRWLERPIFTVAALGGLSKAFNVECNRCGTRSWAHGKAPNARPITVRITPTTGRS